MCYLCFQSTNPFQPKQYSSVQKKKERAQEIKNFLKQIENGIFCGDASKEIQKLKEEQYELSKVI